MVKMFDTYRKAFRKTIKKDKDIWERLKWYEKAGIYIYGPIVYVSELAKRFVNFPKDIKNRG